MSIRGVHGDTLFSPSPPVPMDFLPSPPTPKPHAVQKAAADTSLTVARFIAIVRLASQWPAENALHECQNAAEVKQLICQLGWHPHKWVRKCSIPAL